MAINGINEYLSQVMHPTDTTSSINKVVDNQATSENNSDATTISKSFDDIFNAYNINNTNTKQVSSAELYDFYSKAIGSTSNIKYDYSTENASPLEVAQDAYSDLLKMEAEAISGIASDDSTNELSDKLSEMLEDLQTETVNPSNLA